MMENGLYQWYLQYYKYSNDRKTGFQLARKHNTKNEDDDLHALNMEQMIRPFCLCAGLLIVSIVAFIGEIIFFIWTTRRDREY